jgi:hypothetical protein
MTRRIKRWSLTLFRHALGCFPNIRFERDGASTRKRRRLSHGSQRSLVIFLFITSFGNNLVFCPQDFRFAFSPLLQCVGQMDLVKEKKCRSYKATGRPSHPFALGVAEHLLLAFFSCFPRPNTARSYHKFNFPEKAQASSTPLQRNDISFCTTSLAE